MKKETLYLIDGSAYIYRAYHAIAPLTNSKGIPTNAVFGFVNILRRLIKDKAPHYLCVAFDSRGPVFRHEMYPEYKGNRPDMPEDLAVQIPYIKALVKGYNIPCFEEDDFEADDIIASLAVKLGDQGHDVIIVSGDKDLLQLVNDRVVMWDPMKDKIMTPEEIEKKYTIKTSDLLDYFALIGDSSDNVPGVPGVGPKTAAKLLHEYGSLAGIYDNIHSMKKTKMRDRLIDNKESAYLSRDLIRLKEDVEVVSSLEELARREPDAEVLAEIFKELEFSSFLQEVNTAVKISAENFKCITTENQLAEIAAKINDADLLVLDTETTSLDPRKAELVGISLCVSLEEAWYIPVGHRESNGCAVEGQISLERLKEFLAPYLLSEKLAKLAHNLKYDYAVLWYTLGIRCNGPLLDTMIAAYLVDAGRRTYKLDDLCYDIDLQLTPFTEVVNGDKREDCFAFVEMGEASCYSCEDVYGCLSLWNRYEKQLVDYDMMELFVSMEMKVLPILAEMERRGICLDSAALQALSVEFQQKIDSLEQEICQMAGEDFNVNSPKQLGEILFEKLQLPSGRKTKTGYSTDVKVLEKLALKHALPAKIVEYRTVAKLQSTYVEKLGSLIDEKTGRIYTSFNQTITATGRLSSSNPNLQNIPIRSEDGNRIRQAFVPEKGKLFLSADYSQIDLRVLAHYSQDEALLHAFNNGLDIHESTAREIFSNPLFIAPEMRRVAKSINFGIVYGMSSFGLANQLGLSRKEAQLFIDRYFAHYSGVERFMEEIKEQARRDGFVTTLCKRRRLVPEINSKNKNLREFAERIALNTPIQGTAADIIKLAMIEVEKVIAEKRLQASLLLQIHDELVFELPHHEVEEATGIIGEAMESALPLDVPLVVNFKTGESLAKT
ncbi:DNA polymerase I [Desulfopila inferna]|uniref:DNA polymerase I n=1 Tax=Desulfopila inferna TaxID=468528 RepID=UPI001962A2A3|nr:DNA polymerase I [Desulfopila inferna]MBM9605473.1 DNA polymerase I [Desulfopila inferna]